MPKWAEGPDLSRATELATALEQAGAPQTGAARARRNQVFALLDRTVTQVREATRLLWASEPGKLEAIVLEHPRNAMARRRAQRP